MTQPALFVGLHPSIRQVRQQDADRRARGPLTARQLQIAAQTRKKLGLCPHDGCRSWDRCVEKIARHQRERGWS